MNKKLNTEMLQFLNVKYFIFIEVMFFFVSYHLTIKKKIKKF